MGGSATQIRWSHCSELSFSPPIRESSTLLVCLWGEWSPRLRFGSTNCTVHLRWGPRTHPRKSPVGLYGFKWIPLWVLTSRRVSRSSPADFGQREVQNTFQSEEKKEVSHE